MAHHNLIFTETVPSKGQTQPVYMPAGASDAINAGHPDASSQLTQPLGPPPVTTEGNMRRHTSLLSPEDDGLSHERHVQFHTDHKIGDIPLVITPMKRMNPRKLPPTFGAPPGSSVLLPSGTLTDSQVSHRQNMASSQDEMSLGYSQSTQATPLNRELPIRDIAFP